MGTFIPPLDLGQFQPSAAAISSWLYQIWKYLQDNPIASGEQLNTEIANTVTEVVPGAVQEYIEENPVDVPVLSVNNMIGNVVLHYNNLVGDSSTVPIYRASTGETSNSDLLEAWAEGCRFLLVDDTTPYMMYKTTSQGAEVIQLVALSGGGGGGSGDVSSVNGKTGTVVLTYTDFVGSTSTIPVLMAANDEISNNDLLIAWNAGYRFAVVDETDPYIILRDGNTCTLMPIGTPVTSVNGKAGAVTLEYTDLVPNTSSVPLLIAASMPSAADLLTAYNNGNRFLMVDDGTDTSFYALTISSNTVTAKEIGGSGGGSGLQMTTLWTNANSGSTFAAQSIQLSDSYLNYDAIVVSCYRINGTENMDIQPVIFFPALGTKGGMFAAVKASSAQLVARSFTITDSTHFQFSGATLGSTTANEWAIPHHILGFNW